MMKKEIQSPGKYEEAWAELKRARRWARLSLIIAIGGLVGGVYLYEYLVERSVTDSAVYAVAFAVASYLIYKACGLRLSTFRCPACSELFFDWSGYYIRNACDKCGVKKGS